MSDIGSEGMMPRESNKLFTICQIGSERVKSRAYNTQLTQSTEEDGMVNYKILVTDEIS